MQIPVQIGIDYLWGRKVFTKNEWGAVNYFVGANGSGKSLFVEKLIPILKANGLKTRYLSSDRITSWARQQGMRFMNSQLTSGINIDWFTDLVQNSREFGDVHDAFVLLRDNLDIKIKVESILSQLLNRTVLLEEKAGYIIPKIVKGKTQSYSFKENESHGLKMLITILTLLHDDSYTCFVIDEPELYLHPQFQTFLLQEVRKYAGDPKSDPQKKCFFFVTHSPHFVDVRTIAELKNCVVFQPEKLPMYVNQIDTNDEHKLKQLLPRLNTHHKQFFFSPRPIFVEGNTDQQIFSLIQEKRGKFVGSSGATFIDVSGKDELDLYFRLCKQLAIDCQIIVDLDCLLKGALRDTVSKDDRSRNQLQQDGIGTEFVKAWGEVASKLDDCFNELLRVFPTVSNPSSQTRQLFDSISVEDDLEKKRYLMLLAIRRIKDDVTDLLKSKKGEIAFIWGRTTAIIEAFRMANVYILPSGELENYSPIPNHFRIGDKAQIYSVERDYLLNDTSRGQDIESRYGELITILDSVTRGTTVDYKPLLKRHIMDFIHKVQIAFLYGEVKDEATLRSNATIKLTSLSSVIELVSFMTIDKKFTCKIKIKGFEELKLNEFEFDENFNSTKFELREDQITR